MNPSSQTQARRRCTLFATLVAGASSCLLVGCTPGGGSPKDAAGLDAASSPSPDVKANTADSPLAVDKAKVSDGPSSVADRRTTPDVADSASSGGLDTPLSAADAVESGQSVDAVPGDAKIQIDAPVGDGSPDVFDAPIGNAQSDAKDAPMADGPLVVDGGVASDGPRPIAALPAVCPDMRAKGGTDLLIDDLATGNGQIALRDGRNGLWFTMADGAEGTLWPSPAAFQTVLGSGPRGGYAARMYGSGFTTWGAALAVSLSQAQTGPCPFDASAFSGITFWARSATPAIIRVNLATAAFGTPIALATVWQKYTIAFTDLTQRNPGSDAATAAFDPTQLTELQFVAGPGNAFDISVTDVSFTPAGLFGSHPVELCPDVAFDPTPMPSIPHPAGVTFTIDATNATKKHTISPNIYGRNGFPWQPSGGLSKEFRRFGHGLLKLEAGSNSLYNWEINASSGGYNGASSTMSNDGFPSDGFLPAQLTADGFAAGRASSSTLLIGLSLLDYVAGDAAGVMDPNDPGILSTRYKQNKPAKGAPFSLVPDATDGFVYQDERVNWAVHNAPANVPLIFGLDNEPEIWDVILPTVHPSHVSYDEYVNRTIALAEATKTVAPNAEVVGVCAAHPRGLDSLSGWASTGQASAADLAKGPFLEYFLSKLKTEEASFGKRLVDYIEVHYFTAALAGSGTTSDPYVPLLTLTQSIPYTNQDAGVLATRLQAPRSLWDPTFTETTHEYDGTALAGQPLTLVPRLKNRIAAASPGVKGGKRADPSRRPILSETSLAWYASSSTWRSRSVCARGSGR